MSTDRRRSRPSAAWFAALATVLASVLVLPPAAADTAPTEPGVPQTVSAEALPTVQIDGVVWETLIHGNTVYAAGSFTTARPAGAAPGTSTVPRANMLAFDLRTGALITSFNASFNAQVQALVMSPDGTRLYAGGDFTSVNGQTQYRVVALNPSTGAVLPGFRPGINFKVAAVETIGSTVYVGGAFTAVGSSARRGLAAFTASNGALLPWAPQAENGRVLDLAASPDGSRIVVAGNFTSLNGSNRPGYGLGMVSASTGASLPFPVNNAVRNAGTNAAITDLVGDASAVYGVGYHYGPGGNLEGVFKADWNGNIVLIEDCHGDTYSVVPKEGVLYTSSHAHYCNNVDGGFPQTDPWTFHHGGAFTNSVTRPLGNDQAGYFNWGGYPGPTMLHFWPAFTPGTYTGATQATWSVAADDRYVVHGGEFTHVNGVRQQGLVRFADKDVAPNGQGPRIAGTALNPRVQAIATGALRIAWPTSWDPDNRTLTYRLYREGTGTPIFTETFGAPFWDLPARGFTDTGLTPGAAYRYRVGVLDAFGNSTTSGWVAGTAGTSGSLSAYARGVLDDGASVYWRLGEPSGSTVRDWAGRSDALAGGGVARGTTGAIVGDADRAVTLNGSTSALVAAQTPAMGPDTFSVELWFRTTTTSGGRLLGYSRSTSGTSSVYDRHVYLDDSGRVWFGLQAGRLFTVNSSGAYRDGQWHHVVASLGKDGQRLYVDGALVGQRTDVYTGRGFSGVWRAGYDNLAGWPSRPSSSSFSGALDEIAVYPTQLSSAQVAAHRARGIGGVVNQAPVASFTAAVDELGVSVDGRGSSDSDGSVTSWAWQFGDGATATGSTASHVYESAGTYTVRLTVTDDDGATATTTRTVVIPGPVPPDNQAPVASFTTATSGLGVDVDGRGSSDPDGTVTGWAWEFGDGATASGSTAGHTYAAAGTYTVRLTVTDDDGATGSTTRSVTVGTAAEIARDAFGRTTTSGWGGADLGGTWQVSGPAGDYGVADGVGTMRLGSPGVTRTATLPVSQSSVDVQVTVSVDKAATGSGTYLALSGRRTSAGDYHARVRLFESGAVTLSAMRSGTTMRAVLVPGLTVGAGDELRLRLQVTGTSPTAVRAKVWRVGQAEPTAWQVDVSDGTAGWQEPGGLGVVGYVTGNTTNTPTTVRWDDLVAVPVP